MAKVGNRVKETTDTTGTGTLDLNGTPTGFRGFGDEFTSADEVYYLIVDDPDSPTSYEYGVGTFTAGSPDTLSRDTVEGSSNSGNKVSFLAGTKTVISTPTAAMLAPVAGLGGWATKSDAVVAKTTNYTLLAADDGKLIDADGSGNSPAGLTLTLPAAASSSGFVISVMNTGATGTVTIDGNGAETIDGETTLDITDQFGAATVRCDGTEWHAVQKPLATVGQAEAEAGAATTRRAWTAERVGQAIAALGGSISDQQVFDASGTWSKPASGTFVLVECWAGGGSGGRASDGGGGGGGGGAYTSFTSSLTALGATETVTIGAGGAAKSGTNQIGDVGGTTTFGSVISAYGGSGGKIGNGGGGGGGGAFSAGGTTGTTTSGMAGGGPGGGAGGAPNTPNDATSLGGGGSGSGNQNTTGVGGKAYNGGGGGAGGGSNMTATYPSKGGVSVMGGGGGGGGTPNVGTITTGGVSGGGGTGGTGGIGAGNATAGEQPGGGGGGARSGDSGAGGDGRVRVTVW
jgi:hypothetical protein